MPIAKSTVNHMHRVEVHSLMKYKTRGTVYRHLDDETFHSLNVGGFILDLNGYCLDAPDEIPTGSATIEHGFFCVMHNYREFNPDEVGFF